ncbi:hypothetical protein [Streptomyces sp. CAU 1734]|uniref:hypothetical protein n=1 Tax=Streptomyces sp. CAU 1734 TaxID=3140360 RepID=UPI00326124B8
MITETTRAPKSPASTGTRFAWGVLGALLLIWDVFEVVKHQGWVIPAALLGAALPELARLTGLGGRSAPGRIPGGAVPPHNLLNRPLIPLAIMIVFTFLGNRPEDIAAPFTFGMSWLTSIALLRAAGRGGLRAPDGTLR